MLVRLHLGLERLSTESLRRRQHLEHLGADLGMLGQHLRLQRTVSLAHLRAMAV